MPKLAKKQKKKTLNGLTKSVKARIEVTHYEIINSELPVSEQTRTGCPVKSVSMLLGDHSAVSKVRLRVCCHKHTLTCVE